MIISIIISVIVSFLIIFACLYLINNVNVISINPINKINNTSTIADINEDKKYKYEVYIRNKSKYTLINIMDTKIDVYCMLPTENFINLNSSIIINDYKLIKFSEEKYNTTLHIICNSYSFNSAYNSEQKKEYLNQIFPK